MDFLSVATQKPKKAKPKEVVEVDTSLVLGTLELNDNTEFDITQDYFDKQVALFRGVNVGDEFNAMKGWIDANPTRRKTRTGIKRFINAWMSKKQDQSGNQNKGYQQTQAKTNKQEVKDALRKLDDFSWAD